MDSMCPPIVYPQQPISPQQETTATTPAVAPTSASSSSSVKAKEVAPFLKSLRKILDEESDSILCWTTDGKAFEIHDMQRMMDYVLPKYFKHCKYTSFQRQLNYFNFRKWTKSKAVVCTFSNPYFVRDQPNLAWRINRKKALHSSSKSKSSAFGSRKPANMAIKVPPFTPEMTGSPTSFPSPTEGFPMENEYDSYGRDSMTSTTSYESQGEADALDSLDWVDVLYSSLEVAPRMDTYMYPPVYEPMYDSYLAYVQC